jgi:hypothetical protein
MPRISLFISDEDLAIIDAEAGPNRSTFVVASAREAAMRVRRARIDDEIESIMREHADHDVSLAREFACKLADGA